MQTSQSPNNSMSSACESAQDLLFPSVHRLPTTPEDHAEEDAYLRALELEMEIESDLYADEYEEEEEVESAIPEVSCSQMEIRSLIQLPGDNNNSTVWVHTKTGRRAKIILEAQDEQENVGLLEFEDQSQEIRRFDSYSNKKMATMTPRKLYRVDTLTVPKSPGFGGVRLPSMRHGLNPSFDPREGVLTQSYSSLPNLPSLRAGKNPHFSPKGAVFF